MKSGATESSFYYLAQHYKFPENVEVSRSIEELIQSNKQYKILWAHDNCDQPQFLRLPEIVSQIDKIVCVSNWEAEQYIKYNRAPADKITVIHNGVADLFNPKKSKSKTAIFFSAPHKGIAPLPKIWKQVIKNHPDAKLKVFSSYDLYGQDHVERIKLQEHFDAIEELKSLQGVEYSPCIDREELLPHIQDAAFFIHPNVWEETFCVSMAEAMACGCFPIVSDIGALREVSFDRGKYVPMLGENTSSGWKPSTKFINEFAQEISRCFDFFHKQPESFYAATNELSTIIKKNYNWKYISEQWNNFIEVVTEKAKFIDDQYIYTEVYEKNEYEVESFDKDDVVIDIGAHRGFFTKLCMDKGCKQVHCFEPEPENLQQLINNLKDYTHFQPYNLAVSDKKGEKNLMKMAGWNTGIHSFYQSNGVPIKVQTVSLDDILINFPKVSLIKIDTEGAECEILFNSKLLFKVDKIVGEYHNYINNHALQNIIDFLESKNFKIEKIKEHNADSGTFFAVNNTK